MVPARNAGYRTYSERDVEIVRHIRLLLDAGLATATIRSILRCLIERAGNLVPMCAETIAELRREQDRIEASIDVLITSYDVIKSVIEAGEG